MLAGASFASRCRRSRGKVSRDDALPGPCLPGPEDEGSEMSACLFEGPILNSPYERPGRHWELDKDGIHSQEMISIRSLLEDWQLAHEGQWKVTPEKARLLTYGRYREFQGIWPFNGQIEGVKSAIWLTEVAPGIDKRGSGWNKWG